MTKSSTELIWWHFSDLHWETEKSGERKRFLDLLVQNLKKNIDEIGNPDFLIMSGDIAYSGNIKEFEEAKREFFETIREIVSDQSLPIFLVPGNHDLSRKKAAFNNPKLITSITSRSGLDNCFDETEFKQFIKSPFSDFEKFANELTSGLCKDSLGWSHEIEIKNKKIYIAGINSSWASGYKKEDNGKANDKRNLLVSLQQLDSLQKPSEDVCLSILIMHHPLNWLQNVFETQVKNYIQKHFDFVLFGHVHTVHDLSTSISPSGQCVYLPSPAIYNRTSTDSIEYARGYNVVKYDNSLQKGEVYYYKYTDSFGAGGKFTPFIELYEDEKKYYEIHLRHQNQQDKNDLESSYESYLQVLEQYPHLKKVDSIVLESIDRNSYYSHSVDIYDNIAFSFIKANNIIESDYKNIFWECFFIARVFLMFELVEFQKNKSNLRKFDLEKIKIYFTSFLQTIQNDHQINLAIDKNSYSNFVWVDLDKLALYELAHQKIPQQYLRYYSIFWLFSQISFCFNYPKIIPLVLPFDSRVNDFSSNIGADIDINIINAKYIQQSNCLSIELRTDSKQEFLAVTTFKHYLDNLFKEIADFWRNYHRIFPPLLISLEYPLWNRKDISGSYLNVEATPIIKLLMGKAFYGGKSNVWFREIIQNAIDANSTRQALEPSEYQSIIEIEYDEENICIIRDNGIGMSYQHIIRYLTTLGKSIWLSEELENEKSERKLSKSIGKFGIGFVSVFQDAERVYVKTKFFQEIGEDGWLVDFSSVDKPFFIEKLPTEIGTEIKIMLKEHLSLKQFHGLIDDFFLYLSDQISIIPHKHIAHNLNEVKIIPEEYIRKVIIYDVVSEHSIGNKEFYLRTCFGYYYNSNNDKDKLPQSYLLVSNSGVKVFEQNQVFLKPGKRYIWIEEDEKEARTPWSQKDDNDLKNFWIILDFKKGHSPILPSRIEIDIEQDFSRELLILIDTEFSNGLESILSQELDIIDDLETRRSKCILYLIHSTRYSQKYFTRKNKIYKFCSSNIIQDKAIKLYAKYCPLNVKNIEENERFIYLSELKQQEQIQVYALKSVAKTSLFKVYVRALNINEWVQVDSEREFFLLEANLDETWQGIFNDRDIYKIGVNKLFKENIESPLTKFIRGDYGIIDSDIFGQSALIELPGNLPGNLRKGEAARFTRFQIYNNYPPRILLNMNHQFLKMLQEYLSNRNPDKDNLKFFKLLLDNFADGVVEQKLISLARERWITIRQSLTDLTGQDFTQIDYSSLKG